MDKLPLLLAFTALAAPAAFAQAPQRMVGVDAVKISDHVWATTGFPNIAFVVGSRATLVVDTGLGPKNGAIDAGVAAKLAPANTKLFLTTTHFHPEHASGASGFPPGTILIRNAEQQEEMNQRGIEYLGIFSKMSDQVKDLLAGVTLRSPDITFDKEATLDLGGVTVRLISFGNAHSKGDELIFVEPDRTLVSGDVVQNQVIPGIAPDGGTPTSWLAVVDQIAALHPEHVIPDHSPPGDGSLVAAERSLIADLRTHALALKRQGVTADEAGKQISAELKLVHPDWRSTNATAFVASVYADPQ